MPAETTTETAKAKTWDELTDPRERDAAVAERVMGWEWRTYGPGFSHSGHIRWMDRPDAPNGPCGPDIVTATGDEPAAVDGLRWVPKFSTDPAADYAVLEHVRREWLFSRRQAFVRALHETWRARPLGPGKPQAWPDCAMEYRPGDYSEAAYRAASGREGQT